MNPSVIEKAREETRDWFQFALHEKGMLDDGEKRLLDSCVSLATESPRFGLHISPGDDRMVRELLNRSEKEALAYEAVAQIAAIKLENAQPLDIELQRWVVRHLKGEQRRPRKRGRRALATSWRDLWIATFVLRLTEPPFDFAITRNEATSRSVSAADGVSEIASEFGIRLSSKRISEIAQKFPLKRSD